MARGFRVASYDMLGQGHSDKPRLFIEQHEQVEVLRNLIASLGTRPIFVGGISFGGAIALRYAIEHPWSPRFLPASFGVRRLLPP